ncbi:hypothetical protein BH10ACT3_BH10ACT3_13610 [soil metagenome]
MLLAGPILRLLLRRRGRREIAADLGLLTWPLTVFECSLLVHLVLRSTDRLQEPGSTGSLATLAGQLLTLV